MELNTPVFRQNDPRWAAKVMKPSPKDLGSMGCLVTSVASMLNQFGYTEDPGTVCDKLVAAGGFMPSGDLILNKVAEVWPRVALGDRNDTTANTAQTKFLALQIDVAIQRIKKLAMRGIPTLINVDNVGNDDYPDHWVLVVDDNLNIMDPARGVIAPFASIYGDPMKGVKGFCTFAAGPVAFLDHATLDQRDIGSAIGIAAAASKVSNHALVRQLIESLTR